MHFNSVLAVSATLFALGLATDPLAFTSWPKDVRAGKPVTLTWEGAVPDQVQ
jgi:type IV pilus biogenesis protein CpaD/CtpE